jgi:hypothetical protein
VVPVVVAFPAALAVPVVVVAVTQVVAVAVTQVVAVLLLNMLHTMNMYFILYQEQI